MRWVKGLRSGAFRFALLLALAFAASAVLLLVVVERSISSYADAATEGGLKSESAILQGEEREGGRADLLKAIDRHRRAGGAEEAFRYQLVDQAGHTLVNDLGPNVAKVGWGTVEVTDDTPGRTREDRETFKSLGAPLAHGGVLVVATDTYDIQELRRSLSRFTILAGLGITLVALVGGYLTGGLFMRRLERVNDAIGRIMGGNVAERLPTIGISREFDELSSNLNRMLDRMSALMDGLRQVSTDIAHDLRTPLTRLRQQLEATRESGAVAVYEAGIDHAVAQTDEILAIFRALLRIGTLEGGDGRQRFEIVDLSEIVAHVVSAYQPVAEDAGKALRADVAADLRIEGDAELLAQLLTNLIDNAIRHTPRGTQIVVMLARAAEMVVVSVSDDGPGIPVQDRANVLTRFYRLDRSRNLPGAGLGMALAAAIASLHHVELELLDNDPGLRICLRFRATGQPSLAQG